MTPKLRNKKKKKHLIILVIILASLLIIGVLALILSNSKSKTILQKGRKQNNRTEEYQVLIPGLWQSGEHVFYRFIEDGTGHTWDTEDDLSESEASPFQWKISKSNTLVLTHQLKIRGFVPRLYQIDQLNEDIFQFHDPYSSHTLKRTNK